MPISTPAPAQALEQGPQIGQILLLLLYLALIFAGAYFVTRFFARTMQHGSFLPAKGDRLSIEREKSILLIEADSKRYLLGVSENAFALLETNDAPPEEEAEPQRAPTPFRDVFTAWKKREEGDYAPKE